MRATYHIEAPVEKIFDFFFDPRKSAGLDAVGTEIREVQLTEEGTGSYYSWRFKMAGVPFEGFDAYTDVEPNKHITDGTKVTMKHESRSF